MRRGGIDIVVCRICAATSWKTVSGDHYLCLGCGATDTGLLCKMPTARCKKCGSFAINKTAFAMECRACATTRE